MSEKAIDMEAVIAAIDDLHKEAFCHSWQEADALTVALGLPIDQPDGVPNRLRALLR